MSDPLTVQWFPGHMAKTERQIKAQLALVDAVAEIVDARIPVSSRNPDLDRILQRKPRLILLNKCDMADEVATAEWIAYYSSGRIPAIPVDCKSGKGIAKFSAAVKDLLSDTLAANRAKGLVGKPLRVMVVGIPNVGKSTFINRIAGNTRAKTENRPGVTRTNQWYTVDRELELLDTPGVLWPKFDDKTVGEHLAFTGAVKDSILDIEGLAVHLCALLAAEYPNALPERYGIEVTEDGYETLLAIGARRGFRIKGGEIDVTRAANTVLDEFRSGALGRITLERRNG